MTGDTGQPTWDPSYKAAIFDVDAVTDAADLHAAAWRSLVETLLPSMGQETPAPSFERQDYRRHMHGHLSEDVIRTLADAYNVRLGEGDSNDPAGAMTIRGLATRKRELFAELVKAHGVVTFPSTAALLRRLRSDGVKTALIVGCHESDSVLPLSGVGELFDTVLFASGAADRRQPAVSMADLLREAVGRLRVEPSSTAVIMDCPYGVEAASSLTFARVIGVDRGGRRALLQAAGADLVVNDLGAIEFDAPLEGAAWRGGADENAGPWKLAYSGYDPHAEGFRETLCTLANGYWGSRGAAPSATADAVHYPGTYLAGVYNQLDSEVVGIHVSHESIVNIPNWLPTMIRHGDGTPVDCDHGELESYEQVLDVRRCLLTRAFVHRDQAGRLTRVSERRFLSLAEPHLAALETTIEALNWSGSLRMCSALDADVTNTGVAEHRRLAGRHLKPVTATELDGRTLLLETVTSQSGVHIALAARVGVCADGKALDVPAEVTRREGLFVGLEFSLEVSAGRPVTIDKVVAVASSRDRAISTPHDAACLRLAQAPDFATLLAAHQRVWAMLWEDFAVEVVAGSPIDLAMHLHNFHVLQTVVGSDLDAGVGARGLHGEGYRGHVFWDELFVYPMLTLRRPGLTRQLLAYRSRRLPAARAAAAALGLPGALFPWQSASDGRESTPTVVFNRVSGQWQPDTSHRQRHVGLAIAYGVIQYYEATADTAYLADAGGELLVEICRFAAALPTYDPVDDRFHIDATMGPDEFHDGYPGHPGEGVRDNTYTNVLTAWLLNRVISLLTVVDRHDGGRLRRRMRIGPAETQHWDLLSRRLAVPRHADGVLSQFEGYENLPEFDWLGYRARYGNIQRLELILTAEGDSANNYRISKQADVLMLFYLFSAEELREVLHRMGYSLTPEAIRATVDFYTARTSHGSTLSRIVHAWVNARANRHQAWSLFTQAMKVDLTGTEGGTREGVHLGAMAGTVDIVVRCFGGVETRNGALWLHPVLPPEMAQASFTVVYRDQPIRIELTPRSVGLRLLASDRESTTVYVEGERAVLRPGDTCEVLLRGRRSEAVR